MKLNIPDFNDYEEEADFWDHIDTGPFMEDDGEWVHMETPEQHAVKVAITPEIASEIVRRAHKQGISLETYVNLSLLKVIREPTETS